jgi:hypothetical protein
MSNNKITLNLEIAITDSEIEDIIEDAGYVQHSWNLGGRIDSDNRVFTCSYDDGDEVLEASCTFEDIIRAIEKLAETRMTITSDLAYKFTEGSFAGDMDAEDYDCIVQTALFGDVIYG